MPFISSSDSKAWNSSATSDLTKPTCETPSSNPPHTLSRKQWRNRQKNKRRQKNKFRPFSHQSRPQPQPLQRRQRCLSAPSPDSHGARAEALRARMLPAWMVPGSATSMNSCTQGSAAQRLFQEDPEAFLLYHRVASRTSRRSGHCSR